jgi:hypothetical protein
MRFFLWLLTLFAAAIGLAVLARFNPGNVVFFYPPYRVDLSLNFFIIAMVVLFLSPCFAPFPSLLSSRPLGHAPSPFVVSWAPISM